MFAGAMNGASVSRRMRSGASGELTELARRRMTSAVLRLVAYVITPMSEVQRLGRVD